MGHRYHSVNTALSDYVRTILVIDGSNAGNPDELPLFTNGVPALVCSKANDRCRLRLFGGSIPPGLLLANDDEQFIILLFQPFALGPLFKVSAKELRSGSVELDRLAPQKAMALNLQLVLAGTVSEMIDTLTHFVLSQAKTQEHEYAVIKKATDELLHDPRAERLAALHKELNLTERTFQRIFKKYVGIAPNEYRRICQFQMAFFQLKGGHYNKLADVAYDHGYFDQSHYIRSFREFVDTTPNAYLQFGLRKQ